MLKHTGVDTYIKFLRIKSLVMMTLIDNMFYIQTFLLSSTSSFFNLLLVYFLSIHFDLYCWNLTFISLFFSRAHKF